MNPKNITNKTWTLSTNTSIWNFYPTKEAATAVLNSGTVDANYTLKTYGEFRELEKAAWLDDEPEQITEEEYYYALEVLPPLNWRTINGISTFFMSERTSGTFTNQYAKVNGEFYRKMVDLADQLTWIEGTYTSTEIVEV